MKRWYVSPPRFHEEVIHVSVSTLTPPLLPSFSPSSGVIHSSIDSLISSLVLHRFTSPLLSPARARVCVIGISSQLTLALR